MPARGVDTSAEPDVSISANPAVAVAQGLVGVPYRYGGASPQKGVDCSGLIYFSYREAGVAVPRTTEQMRVAAFPVKQDHLQPGDILFFRLGGKVSHVGIFVEDGFFLHAPSTGKRVSYERINNPYWQERMVGAGRFY